jgi:hypothetical protein
VRVAAAPGLALRQCVRACVRARTKQRRRATRRARWRTPARSCGCARRRSAAARAAAAGVVGACVAAFAAGGGSGGSGCALRSFSRAHACCRRRARALASSTKTRGAEEGSARRRGCKRLDGHSQRSSSSSVVSCYLLPLLPPQLTEEGGRACYAWAAFNNLMEGWAAAERRSATWRAQQCRHSVLYDRLPGAGDAAHGYQLVPRALEESRRAARTSAGRRARVLVMARAAAAAPLLPSSTRAARRRPPRHAACPCVGAPRHADGGARTPQRARRRDTTAAPRRRCEAARRRARYASGARTGAFTCATVWREARLGARASGAEGSHARFVRSRGERRGGLHSCVSGGANTRCARPLQAHSTKKWRFNTAATLKTVRRRRTRARERGLRRVLRLRPLALLRTCRRRLAGAGWLAGGTRAPASRAAGRGAAASRPLRARGDVRACGAAC